MQDGNNATAENMRGRGYAETKALFPLLIIRTTMERDRLNEIGGIILDSAITVHRELGPGLLESAYRLALRRELELRGLFVREHVPIEYVYKGASLNKVYEID
ncbi:MAG TPA: GxxExxY protein, partial [Ferruginibacter sp.]|nr:GxxExxY protein [Ferruginibacter sp.]